MIRYQLKCAKDHSFESWFQSSDAYETLHKSNLISCAVCGTSDVKKSLMTPKVRVDGSRGEANVEDSSQPVLSTPNTEVEAKLTEMRQHIEANSDYVGRSFASEARAMHEGDQPQRSIYGEVDGKEAKSLVEDGVPVLPLPFTPKRQTN